MQALVKYAQECDASFRAPAAEFQHAELQNTPEMRERRFKSGVDALEPSVEKMKHGFTIFSMLDSRADAESEEGAGMRKDLLKDLRKFGEFGGVLAANCGSHCLRSHVLAGFRAVFVAALGMFAQAIQAHKDRVTSMISPGVVWSALDDLKQLPKTDKSAFRRTILKVYGVVKDTADEFNEAARKVKIPEEPMPDTDAAKAQSSAEAPATPVFKVDDQVECKFEADLGGIEWFPGRVESIGPNSTYNILYDDGDREPNVKAQYIRERGSGPAIDPAALDMQQLGNMMMAMMKDVDDFYSPEDAAVVETSVLLLRSMQKSLKVLSDGTAKVPKVLPMEKSQALDKLDAAILSVQQAATDFGFSLYAPLKPKAVTHGLKKLEKIMAKIEKAASAEALQSEIDGYALHVAVNLFKERAASIGEALK